ncbi:MAG: Lrp/AsnC family transcriptional regulator [Deltaproteobacteria bacterium]|jgi:DNA-binding Lrp family transcriptional regulator|nr:Lrp/AsnC family transcriptional regulator [Deltaproteobacteria bacterium]
MLHGIEKKIINLIQSDIPLAKRPFKSIGEQADLSEEKVLAIIGSLIERGIVRKFGAILRHQRAGFTRNAMVVWAAPQEKIGAAGRTLSSFREVTHCYERTPPFAGKYTLFSMVHCREGDQEVILKKLSMAAGIKDFKILTSEEEYKKSSMEYCADVK